VFNQNVIGFLDSLFLYLSCSQIWLNPLVADHHFWTNMRKLGKKKKKKHWFYSQIWLNPFSGWLPVHPKRPPCSRPFQRALHSLPERVEEHRENCGAFEERREIVEGFSSARSIWLSLDASCSAWYKNWTPPPNSSFRNRFIASTEFGITVLTQEHCWFAIRKAINQTFFCFF
jgi:hypothetical protein